MVRRLPSQPPVLPGFSYLHILGTGGFADVFLYEQNMPRRQVAVKVMLAEIVNDEVRQMFQAEANLMAQLSAHPSILTVYQAGVSADGRPYLVMELCSPALSQRYRNERIPVAEVLKIAIRIGSAIETAHQAGVLHRDIKPSNILLTAYGHPVLSDFGIASTLSETGKFEAVGMSIPWSAPEVLLDETSGTIASEVWAYGATIYSLLGGRSPFEVLDGSNKPADLIARITRARPQPLDRPDVPASLEKLLRRTLSRKPENRPGSAIEVVRALQGIEAELGVQQTPVDLAVDDWATASVGDAGERTRIRPSRTPVAAQNPRRRRRLATGPLTTLRDGDSAAPAESTLARGEAPRMTALAWALVVSAVLVIALGTISTWVLIRSGLDQIPQVTNIESRFSADAVTFSWSDPGLAAGDTYQVSTDGGETSSIQQAQSFTAVAEQGDRVCLIVTVNREGRTGPPSNEKCVEFAS